MKCANGTNEHEWDNEGRVCLACWKRDHTPITEVERELRIRLWGAWLKGWRQQTGQEPPPPAMQACKASIDALVAQHKALLDAASEQVTKAADEATAQGRQAAHDWLVIV